MNMTSLRPDMRPNRVMTSPDLAVTPKQAGNTVVDLIFERDDNWKLGCPMSMVFWAHRTWADQWKGVLVREYGHGWQYYKIDDWRKTYFGTKGNPRF